MTDVSGPIFHETSQKIFSLVKQLDHSKKLQDKVWEAFCLDTQEKTKQEENGKINWQKKFKKHPKVMQSNSSLDSHVESPSLVQLHLKNGYNQTTMKSTSGSDSVESIKYPSNLNEVNNNKPHTNRGKLMQRCHKEPCRHGKHKKHRVNCCHHHYNSKGMKNYSENGYNDDCAENGEDDFKHEDDDINKDAGEVEGVSDEDDSYNDEEDAYNDGKTEHNHRNVDNIHRDRIKNHQERCRQKQIRHTRIKTAPSGRILSKCLVDPIVPKHEIISQHQTSSKQENKMKFSKNKCKSARNFDNKSEEVVDILKEHNIERKLKLSIEKIVMCMDNIRMLVETGIPPPDGAEDLARRKKRAVEFSARFSRVYLYQISRQITELHKLMKPQSGRNSSRNVNVYQKLLMTHQIVLQAFQAYHHHMPSSIAIGVPEKLKELIGQTNSLCEVHRTIMSCYGVTHGSVINSSALNVTAVVNDLPVDALGVDGTVVGGQVVEGSAIGGSIIGDSTIGGLVMNSSTKNCSIRNGSVKNQSFRNSSVKKNCARNGSVRSGSIIGDGKRETMIKSMESKCKSLQDKIQESCDIVSSHSLLQSNMSKLTLLGYNIPKQTTQLFHKKNLNARLSMYSMTGKKDPYWKKAVASLAHKKFNVESRYKTSLYKHRPPIVKQTLVEIPSRPKLVERKPAEGLWPLGIKTPLNDDKIMTMVQAEKAREIQRESGRETFYEMGACGKHEVVREQNLVRQESADGQENAHAEDGEKALDGKWSVYRMRSVDGKSSVHGKGSVDGKYSEGGENNVDRKDSDEEINVEREKSGELEADRRQGAVRKQEVSRKHGAKRRQSAGRGNEEHGEKGARRGQEACEEMDREECVIFQEGQDLVGENIKNDILKPLVRSLFNQFCEENKDMNQDEFEVILKKLLDVVQNENTGIEINKIAAGQKTGHVVKAALSGKRPKRRQTITVTGEKNARLICIRDEDSIMDEHPSEQQPENAAKQSVCDTKQVNTQTGISDPLQLEMISVPSKNSINLGPDKSMRNMYTDNGSRTSIKISRLPKKSLNKLSVLPKNYALNVIQYKLEYHKFTKGSHMYRKSASLQPWILTGKIGDRILEDLLVSITREIEINEILETLYQSEFQ